MVSSYSVNSESNKILVSESTFNPKVQMKFVLKRIFTNPSDSGLNRMN